MEEDYNMIKKSFRLLILFVLVLLFLCSSFAQYMNPISTEMSARMIADDHSIDEDSTSAITRDLAIINGNRNEYLKFCDKCRRSVKNDTIPKELQQKWLLYAFIMAEQYQDTLAAFDFARLIENIDIEIDSSMAARIIRYYEMVSRWKPDNMSFLAAHRLFLIYGKGIYGIPQDKKKSEFYDKLSDTIAKSIK